MIVFVGAAHDADKTVLAKHISSAAINFQRASTCMTPLVAIGYHLAVATLMEQFGFSAEAASGLWMRVYRVLHVVCLCWGFLN